MAKPIDIITGALKDIGALAAGESPTADAAQDALDMLNLIVDQWSNENMMVFNIQEIIWNVIPGQVQYTIGPNHTTANFIGAQYTGSIAGNVLTVTGISSGAVVVNQYLSGTGISDGTRIIATLTGAGGNVNEVGTYQLDRTYASPVSSQLLQAYYAKPLNINSAYVRINTSQSSGSPILTGGIDYPVAILALDNYNSIGLKTLNGPWPKALYFNANEDSGNVFLWPSPSQGEVHMFAETLFRIYASLYDDATHPQGYTAALRWCLGERLCPMYGKTDPAILSMITAYAAQAKATLKSTNMAPMRVSRYQDALLMSKAKDAGWILTGGFTN
jgi:hypothetical protein